MSKVDAMRALREARLNAPTKAAVPTGPTKTSRQAAPPARTAKPVAEVEEGLCGHRSMNGRSCTRESGHAEKNHRYG